LSAVQLVESFWPKPNGPLSEKPFFFDGPAPLSQNVLIAINSKALDKTIMLIYNAFVVRDGDLSAVMIMTCAVFSLGHPGYGCG
jgi:hypothetical protein